MEQTPPFPSPEELKSKLAEFMKSNFGDRVAFTTLTQPDTVETGTDEKSPPEEAKDFEFHFLPRDIKAHLDRFVIKQSKRRRFSRLQSAITTTTSITSGSWRRSVRMAPSRRNMPSKMSFSSARLESEKRT